MRRRVDIASERGQTAVEFALFLPLIATLLFSVIQFGIAFNNYVTLTDATRAGARRAAVERLSGLRGSDIEAAVKAAASDLNQADVKVTVTSTNWSQSGADVSVQATYPCELNLIMYVLPCGPLKSSATERLE